MLLTAAPATAHPQTQHPQHSCSTLVSQIWAQPRWRRAHPKGSAIIGWRKLHCPKSPWLRAKKRFYAHRKQMLWRVRVTPFRGGGRWWPIPYSVVYCESGADGHDPSKPSGYYGILLDIWSEYGGGRFAAEPWEASDKEQALIAHKLYRLYGLSPWECASIVGLI